MLAISPIAVAVMYMLMTGGIGVANQVAPTTVTASVTVSLLCLLFARYANASLFVLLGHSVWIIATMTKKLGTLSGTGD